jgi:hypothetical protein
MFIKICLIYPFLFHTTKIKLAGNLRPSIILDHAWSSFQISAHLVISSRAALSRQILLASRLGFRVPPGMLEHATGCDALLGIENERLHEKIHAIGAYGAKTHLVPILSTDRMLSRDSVAGEFGDTRPVVVGRSADKLADKADLVEIGVAREVGRTHDQLGKDSAD